jgi:hypothetical protein
VEGGFTVDDFTVDEQAGMVTCPAGNIRPISQTRVATFGALCRDCPVRERCTTSKTGRKIVLHPRDALLRQARRDWADKPERREKYRKYRPNVERVISQIASRGGRRLKLRFRGTTKYHAWLTRRTTGLNLRKLVGRGLTRSAGVLGSGGPDHVTTPPIDRDRADEGLSRPPTDPPRHPLAVSDRAVTGCPGFMRGYLPFSRLGPCSDQPQEPPSFSAFLDKERDGSP